MPALTIPNSFSGNTTIRSSEVNANFNAVSTLLNSTKLDSTNIQTSGVATANLADAAVTTAKIADSSVTTAKINDSAVTTAKLNDGAVTLAKLDSGVLPAGIVMPFAGTSLPTGWLWCDGSAVSRTTYSALFTAIGETHGEGNNSTTFNVPDYRGRFLRGTDTMGSGAASRDPDKASRTAMNTGGNTGDAVGSVQEDEFESHTHVVTGYASGVGGTGAAGSGSVSAQQISPGAANTGGNETRPKNAYVNFIIKY